jgi:GDP-4-dehydro-6-deoxy-D-mannose reductase
VLVTGAAGFAGSHLVELLSHDGANLFAWHRPGGRPHGGAQLADWRPVDLLDAGLVRRAVAEIRPDAIYHCAGAAHVGQSWGATEATLRLNVLGTHHLLEALRATGVDARVLIPSSGMIYGRSLEPLTEDHALVPPSPYGLSKLAQELLGLRASTGHVRVAIARAFNHLGPRQSPMFAASSFAKQIAEIEAGSVEPDVIVGNLEARRDTLDVRDTVRAYRVILERGAPGRVYNVSSGTATSARDVLEMLITRSRVPVKVRVDPARFRPNDLPVVAGDSSRLREELGWEPEIPLSKTLDDLLSYWRNAVQTHPGQPTLP